jgi:hypothetical protein
MLGEGIALELPRLLDRRSLKAHTTVPDCLIVSALETKLRILTTL